MYIPRSRSYDIAETKAPSVSNAAVGSLCWRRPVEHHNAAVLSEFSWSLLDLTQLATPAVHSEIAEENTPTAAGRQEQYT